MNIFKKIYCRTFQTVFRLAIPFLPYRSPRILKEGAEVASLLKEKGILRVLIVTDSYIYSSGMTKQLESALGSAKIGCSVYDGVVSNPTVENVETARKIYLDDGCDALIGFGGGSSIDCAKAVGARIAKPRRSLAKMEGILRIMKKTPMMIAVPTTAGTGSEVTVATVITDVATRHKFPISDFCLIPSVAMLSPELTRNLPKHLTATTGMDALTHAVEAYIGNSTVKATRSDSKRAVRLIFDNLERAYENGDDMEARENMLKGAFLAGRAFSKSYVGYCHAVAHSLGGRYNTPHGLANAVLLPYTLELYGDLIYNKLKDLAVAGGIAGRHTDEEVAARAFIEYIRRMNEQMGIPDKLSDIKEEDIPELARIAEKEANPLYPVPKLMTDVELRELYYMASEARA